MLQHSSRKALLSMTYPNKELFFRQRALLKHTMPRGSSPGSFGQDGYPAKRRESTFFMRVSGDSMQGLGILDGDLLVVDRALTPKAGSIVIAVVEGEFLIKQLHYSQDGPILRSAHPDYPDMHIQPGQDFTIWGVVVWNVH